MAKLTPEEEIKKLQDEVARLTGALAVSDEKLTSVQEAAKKSVEQQLASMQTDVREVATGDTVKVKRLDKFKVVGYKDDGREIREPIWKEVELPTFFYKIDLPPSGGEGVVINGQYYYHGQTYTVDIDLLRDLKDKVARAWGHEQTINGRNENVFRKPRAQTLSARG